MMAVKGCQFGGTGGVFRPAFGGGQDIVAQADTGGERVDPFGFIGAASQGGACSRNRAAGRIVQGGDVRNAKDRRQFTGAQPVFRRQLPDGFAAEIIGWIFKLCQL